MLGTIVNVIFIIAGTFIGLIINDKFSEKLQNITTQALGLATIFVGLTSALTRFINEPCNSILFVISLVIGGIIGTLLDIEGKMKKVGDYLESKFKNNRGSVSKSFVSASILFCTGTMAIIGSIESGIDHNYSILFTKSILDGTYSIIIASTMGIGVIFSSISVFLYQGAITMLAYIVKPCLTGDIMREISIVGGILITGLGIDMLGIKKLNIANLLPAVVIPVIYYGFVYIFIV